MQKLSLINLLMNNFLIKWINQTYIDIIEKENYLNELDSNIGDGDHGTAILKGISSVKKILNTVDFEIDINIFNKIAKKIRSDMGGASGILTSIFFEELSNLNFNKVEISLIPIFENTVLRIKKRGKVEPGDKSLLDVYNSVYLYLKKNNKIINIYDVIKNSTNSTIDMEASVGRAKFLEKKGLGFIDPGAKSTEILLINFFKEILNEKNYK